ncbi:3-methyl-2-oxobutanoate hydroxymethyltransferase [Kitasatospora viridis]|uniref:3-methyl-2-oxobutanoate hydroxymethyltransferase n=1 Tax=Kitasatospora viridis TaxID=281105 RepID=A0A561ULV5_9ACTN|nr:3-methyl-2-oxobutanoate hydroxymethyltransferase [Kitasatospora viridis]TWG00335.1 ketopantoate hydroxymethyltransferase [Kitasatospora viridis]
MNASQFSPAQTPEPAAPASPDKTATGGGGHSLYGGVVNRRVTVRDLAAAKQRGERWAMLTAYDSLTAGVFDEAGIPVLLVGDSAGNCALGYESTVPVTMDEMTILSAAVVRGTKRAMVVGDLPFGSYQESPAQALRNAARLMKEAGVGAVKLEGGERSARTIELLVESGVPVMAHVGLTPQSVHALGGYPVQGRGEEAAHRLQRDAKAVQEAGAFAVVLEAVPAELAAQVTAELAIPTVGIGAGVGCDAQVLVWTDMAGMNPGHTPKFVKQYADLRGVLGAAARQYADEVRGGTFPDQAHSFK